MKDNGGVFCIGKLEVHWTLEPLFKITIRLPRQSFFTAKEFTLRYLHISRLDFGGIVIIERTDSFYYSWIPRVERLNYFSTKVSRLYFLRVVISIYDSRPQFP